LRLAIIGGALADGGRGYPGYVDDLRSLARRLGIDGSVVWTGDYSWDSDEASVYLRGVDTCVLPFDKGIKLNNSSFSSAAAHGLPVITTADAHVEPQFVHGENVFLCRPESPEALAASIETVIADVELRNRLRNGSLTLANQWFHWDSAIDRTIDLLNRQNLPPTQGRFQSDGRSTHEDRLSATAIPR
jgi:glycosyltransferase involved in cell wall biosynthesis